jgi:hypothetical protein
MGGRGNFMRLFSAVNGVVILEKLSGFIAVGNMGGNF